MTEPGEQLRLHDRKLTLLECLPADFAFLDDYQHTVGTQIQWDDAEGGRIQGRDAKQYMLDGIDEETHELTHEADRVEPGYRRFGALLMLGGDNPAFEPGDQSPTAIQRHLKEFGDVAWYLANYLSLFDLSYSDTIRPGLLDWQLKRAANAATRGSEEFSDATERTFPALLLAYQIGRLRTASRFIVDQRRDDRALSEENLVISAGGYTLSAVLTLANRYDMTYEAVLNGNLKKVENRISSGTVFDKAGGDDR